MKITASQKNLRKALSICEKVVGRNVSLPILNNILLKTENGRLKISATNLELGVNCHIGAKIEETGEITIPAKIFFDFVNSIHDEKISLSVRSNIISINSNQYKTQIYGLSADEFPIIPKVKAENSLEIEAKTLKEAFEAVLDSAAISETRPELAGIFVKVSAGLLTCAATDGFRLAEKITAVKSDKSFSLILPKNAAVELVKVCGEVAGLVTIKINENQISFSTEDFELVSRLIEGNYPDYKKVIPEKITAQAIADKEEFEKGIRMAGIFSSNISDIKIIFTAKEAEIFSKNSSKGELKAKTTVALKNEPFDISINYSYLLEGLKIIKDSKVAIIFTGQSNPLIVKPANNDEGLTYLVMPLRV